MLDNREWALSRVADVIAGRDFLLDRFAADGLISFPSQANFVLLGCSSTDAARDLVLRARGMGFALRGPISTPLLKDFVRVTAGPLTLMEEFWTEAGSAIRELGAGREG